MAMRKSFSSNVRFMLMNSFSTSEDTLEFLQKYPELVNDPNLELMQVRVWFWFWCFNSAYSVLFSSLCLHTED